MDRDAAEVVRTHFSIDGEPYKLYEVLKPQGTVSRAMNRSPSACCGTSNANKLLK